MPATTRSKSSAARRRAAGALDTNVSRKLSPTMQKRADEMLKKYNQAMYPQRLIRQQEDRQLLRSLFDAFGGTNKSQWHIVDPVMAEVFPNSFYAKS